MIGGRSSSLEKRNVHVALLRGINVGGRNKLPMSSLVEIFNDAGCSHVRTYIQSGNVVFEAAPALASRIPAVIAQAVLERFGFEVPVVVRTAEDFSEIVQANPFLKAGADERTLHVAYLADLPDVARIGALDLNRPPPDEFEVRGREIYLRCPDGLARTKLTNAYFDSKLGTTSTVRNWRTTLRLLALAVE